MHSIGLLSDRLTSDKEAFTKIVKCRPMGARHKRCLVATFFMVTNIKLVD